MCDKPQLDGVFCHAEGVVSTVESDELRLEEDVAPNLEADRARLDPSEAFCHAASMSVFASTLDGESDCEGTKYIP